MSSLASLPAELFACILDCVPSINLQQTTISLLRIFSYGRIPNWRHYLFYHIHLTRTRNIQMLDQHLQRIPSDAELIKKFSLGPGIMDAKATINVVLMIPKLEWLSLYLGMLLEFKHLFRKPMPNLRYLSLRFNSKVICKAACCTEWSRDVYYRGSCNYESILATLASWPSANLLAISVVQDPTDHVPKDGPTMFFLGNLSILASSPLLERTQALRLRIPQHEYVYRLLPSRNMPTLPHITFLDLSFSYLSDSDVTDLLRELPRLRHLIIDGCGPRAQDWDTFARYCMLAHSDLAREKYVNRGLAARGDAEGSRPREARIIPRTSALRTLSLSADSHVLPERRQALLDAFQRGWGEAVAMYKTIICTARRSREGEGALILRFPRAGEVGNVQQEQGLDGMVVVDDDEFARLSEVGDAENCPVVCLAGQREIGEGIEHAEGCGHSIGWDIWEDTL